MDKVHELDLHGKNLKVLRNLSKLKCLRVLDASCNNLLKIEGLSENKAMRELKLYGNRIQILGGLEKLAELCTLLLQFNKISFIGLGLEQCRKLRVLRLDHNLLEKVTVGELTACKSSLVHLDLGYNQLHIIEGLGVLGNLVELNLENNSLEQVQHLAQCKKLTHLNLSENPIEIQQLSQLKLPLLEALKLSSISLSSLSYLPKLAQLQELYVPHNVLTDVDACCSLFPSLEFLNVKGNSLETVQALASALRSLGELTELQVEGNPLCTADTGYRAHVVKVLMKLEVLDGVSLKARIPTDSSAKVPPLMRPPTHSSIGLSLRKIEGQLLEAETELLRLRNQIGTKFEMLRDTGEELTNTSSRKDERGAGNTNGVKASRAIGMDTTCTRTAAMSESPNMRSVDANRPLTSRASARLQEALLYASEEQEKE